MVGAPSPPPSAEPLKLYEVGELRQVLGIGRQAAYDLIRRIGVRLGTRYVVTAPVLRRWLEHPTGSTPKAKTRARRRRS